MLRVAIDIDDVLVDSASWVVQHLDNCYGIKIERSDLDTYRLEDNPRIPVQVARAAIEAFHRGGLEEVVARPSDVDSINELASIVSVDILTTRPVATAKTTQTYLRRSGVAFDQLRH